MGPRHGVSPVLLQPRRLSKQTKHDDGAAACPHRGRCGGYSLRPAQPAGRTGRRSLHRWLRGDACLATPGRTLAARPFSSLAVEKLRVARKGAKDAKGRKEYKAPLS